MIQAAIFYIFALMTIASAVMVVISRNPVHSVLFLILAFFNAAGLFILLGAEFIAMILVIVYVGAVAVLFLFVVMMLDISFADLRKGAMQYVPVGLILGVVLLAELVMLYLNWGAVKASVSGDVPAAMAGVTNTEILGSVLYTHYLLPFQISGLILMVAMIGAIVLTLRKRPGVRRQNVSDQNARSAADTMSIEKVETGKGVTL